MSNEMSAENVVPFKSKDEDPGFLVAKGRFDDKILEKTHVKKLAAAMFMAMSNHGYAKIRCIGARAQSNALKAYILAKGYCMQRGVEPCVDAYYEEGNLGPIRSEGHVSDVTAMVIELKGFRDFVEGQKTNPTKEKA